MKNGRYVVVIANSSVELEEKLNGGGCKPVGNLTVLEKDGRLTYILLTEKWENSK